jgi:hypothetical protein
LAFSASDNVTRRAGLLFDRGLGRSNFGGGCVITGHLKAVQGAIQRGKMFRDYRERGSADIATVSMIAARAQRQSSLNFFARQFGHLESVNALYDAIDIDVAQLRMAGQRQACRRVPFTFSASVGIAPQDLARSLPVNGNRVVDERLDAAIAQNIREDVAPGAPNHKEVMDVLFFAPWRGEKRDPRVVDPRSISGRYFAATIVETFEKGRALRQYGGL